MNHELEPSLSPWEGELQEIGDRLSTLAAKYNGDIVALLAILRFLEATHSEIRETRFQEALPTNRQALYALLRDLEAEGGWPYISRMQLRKILEHLDSSES